jgi:hypothetical protein
MRDARDTQSPEALTRPTACPFCQGKRFDTLAKVITDTTCWRCRECDKTWTIASLPGASPHSR